MEKAKQHRSTVKSMVVGNPLKLMFNFMIPLLLGNIFQQAYNMVDGMIVGRMLGEDALAAVGSSSSVQFLTLGLCIGCCAGFVIPIAQRFGAEDNKGMRKYVYHSIILSLILTVIMTTLTVVFCHQILEWMQTPIHIFEDAKKYLLIIFWGIPFSILYNMAAGILRAVGNSRAPFIFLAISTLLNIFLDLFFIASLGWGVAGAGIATIMAQAMAGIICIIYIKKKVPELKLEAEDKKWDWQAAGRLIGMGIPMGMQYSITAIGSMVMQSANNSLGGVYVPAMTAGGRIKILLMSPFDAMSTAVATFIGQNYGAMRMDRVKKGIRQMLLASVLYGILSGAILVIWGRRLSMLFLSAENVGALDASAMYLKYSGYLYWVLGILNISRNSIQALGYSGRAVIAGVIEMIARTLMAILLVPLWGYFAICWTDQAAWITATIYLVIMVIIVVKKRSTEIEAFKSKGQIVMLEP